MRAHRRQVSVLPRDYWVQNGMHQDQRGSVGYGPLVERRSNWLDLTVGVDYHGAHRLQVKGGRPTRRTRSVKRESERRPAKAGLNSRTFSEGERSAYAFSSHSTAWSVSP